MLLLLLVTGGDLRGGRWGVQPPCRRLVDRVAIEIRVDVLGSGGSCVVGRLSWFCLGEFFLGEFLKKVGD